MQAMGHHVPVERSVLSVNKNTLGVLHLMRYLATLLALILPDQMIIHIIKHAG